MLPSSSIDVEYGSHSSKYGSNRGQNHPRTWFLDSAYWRKHIKHNIKSRLLTWKNDFAHRSKSQQLASLLMAFGAVLLILWAVVVLSSRGGSHSDSRGNRDIRARIDRSVSNAWDKVPRIHSGKLGGQPILGRGKHSIGLGKNQAPLSEVVPDPNIHFVANKQSDDIDSDGGNLITGHFGFPTRRIRNTDYTLSSDSKDRFDDLDDYDLYISEASFDDKRSEQPKVIALVEVRNIRHVLPFWISAISMICDAIVVLDDVSFDGTTEWLIQYGMQHRVERIITKRPPWVLREELRDRNLLLHQGRRAGGTHFVLLDYDEVVAYPCAQDGILLNVIKTLKSGESLVLPWVELWRSVQTARVENRGDPPDHNFLQRRQVVIFADAPGVTYTAENTKAHIMNHDESDFHAKTGARSKSVHVRRCPTSVCSQKISKALDFKLLKPEFEAAGKFQMFRDPADAKVLHAPGCPLIEMRFLSIDNVMLKSAWYDLLGRVSSNFSSSTASHGKMMEQVRFQTGAQENSQVLLSSFDSVRLLKPYPHFHSDLYGKVENWRAIQIFEWYEQVHTANPLIGEVQFFSGGDAIDGIDWRELRSSTEYTHWLAERDHSKAYTHRSHFVPRKMGQSPLMSKLIIGFSPGNNQRWVGLFARLTEKLMQSSVRALYVPITEGTSDFAGSGDFLSCFRDAKGDFGQHPLSFEDRKSDYENLIRNNVEARKKEIAEKLQRAGSQSFSEEQIRNIIDTFEVVIFDLRPSSPCLNLDVVYYGFRDIRVSVVALNISDLTPSLPCDASSLDQEAHGLYPSPSSYSSFDSLVRIITSKTNDASASASPRVNHVTMLVSEASSLLSTNALAGMFDMLNITRIYSQKAELEDKEEYRDDVKYASSIWNQSCAAFLSQSLPQSLPQSLSSLGPASRKQSMVKSWLEIFRELECTYEKLFRVCSSEDPLRTKHVSGKVPLAGSVPSCSEKNCAVLARGYLSYGNRTGIPPIARLIFSHNTGRSGSKYLSGLLESVSDPIVSLHEAPCLDKDCSSGGARPMQNVTLRGSFQQRASIKNPLIRVALARLASTRSQQGQCWPEHAAMQISFVVVNANKHINYCVSSALVYSESNPNFKSWFYDVVFESFARYGSGYDIHVIVLRKYIPAIVKSLFETGFFSTRNGYSWMETANSVNSLLPPLAPDPQLSAVDLITSYVLNAELVARAMMDKYTLPDYVVSYHQTRSEQVYSVGGSLDLIKELSLRADVTTLDVAGKMADKYIVKNDEGEEKKKTFKQASLYDMELHVFEYLKQCREHNISVDFDSFSHMRPLAHFAYHQY